MSVLVQIQGDAKTALKAGDAVRVGVLRYMLSQIQNRSIEKRAKGEIELTDEEVRDVLQKEVKRRKESIELFRKGGRVDLAVKEEQEVKVIELYLPPALDPSVIEGVVGELLLSGLRDFNVVMREAMQKLKGKADGKVVSEIVRKKIGENAA
jgi:uncharacterized protein YqeY